jgi:hypothetical protein
MQILLKSRVDQNRNILDYHTFRKTNKSMRGETSQLRLENIAREQRFVFEGINLKFHRF